QPVRWDIDVKIVGPGQPGAVTAVAHTHVVTQLRRRPAADHSVGGDPRGVHVRVTVGGGAGAVVAQRVKVGAFGGSHDDAIDGLVSRISATVHLVEKVGCASRAGRSDPIRIRAQVVPGIARLEVKLNNGVIR